MKSMLTANVHVFSHIVFYTGAAAGADSASDIGKCKAEIVMRSNTAKKHDIAGQPTEVEWHGIPGDWPGPELRHEPHN